jgi:hypothetical protein
MPLDRQPVDAEGVTLPHDHTALIDSDLLVRLVPAGWRVPASSGNWRLASQAFANSSDKYGGCSVLIAKLVEESGATIAEIVRSRGMLGAIAISVREVRSRGLQAGFDPLPDDPHHGQIWGKITRGTSNALLVQSAWAVAIPDTVITDRTT